MKNFFKYTFFSFSLAIIILHTIVPHPHSTELSPSEHILIHKDTDSFFGWMKMVFHEIDDDNLDFLYCSQYRNQKKQTKQISSNTNLSFLSSDNYIFTSKENPYFAPYAFIYLKVNTGKINGLRAPPF